MTDSVKGCKKVVDVKMMCKRKHVKSKEVMSLRKHQMFKEVVLDQTKYILLGCVAFL